ncbi:MULTISPECIES: Crp/Fnr family transcriptional regulator [unclassified Alsobacter]|jgi:CRP-like cAMP-binding protein|uniref:Crp/Fnr family transcriptional regulator n=1 Tax=Alsobacter sp. KACC 23698 TaxID=3149229 RepID=A0AAU7JKD0_9HYPH
MQTLARVPFFKDAGIDFERFDRRCTWRRYDEDEIVVDFEDLSTDVYFILSGEVRVLIRTQSGKEVILAEMRGGQVFGELAAIDEVRRSANVTALTRAEMCIMPSSVFREILFASPVVCDRILKLLTSRVRELNARLTEHSVFDLKHRLYAELIRMSAPRMGVSGERVVSPPPFHHVLAARIGCRREQVTRELSALSGQGVIAKTRGALVIRQPQVLEERISEALQNDT